MRVSILIMLLYAVLSTQGVAQSTFLDPSFNPGLNTIGKIESMLLQDDGKILITGHFDDHVVRLHTDGSLDTSFFFPNAAFDFFYSCAIQTDGKIFVVGNFNRIPSLYIRKILRLHADGTIDSSFDARNGFNSYIRSVLIQPDGKILVCGPFTKYEGINCGGITRLHSDGTLDNSFVSGTGASGFGSDTEVYSMALSPDGSIFICGLFNAYNGYPTNYVAKLHPNGSLDTSFSIPTVAGGHFNESIVYKVVLQPDGKVIIGGHFGTIAGIPRISLARLNSDGSLDVTFDPGGSVASPMATNVYSLLILPDSSILVGGSFDTYQGVNRNAIFRVLPDGTLDTRFDPGSGFETSAGYTGAITSILLQPDGNLLMGGNFTRYNGIEIGFVSRLFGDPVKLEPQDAFLSGVEVYPNPADGYFRVGNAPPHSRLRIIDVMGRVLCAAELTHSPFYFSTDGMVSGTYQIEVASDQSHYYHKLIVR
jgi:uncharacterized delta-60 repeat protein